MSSARLAGFVLWITVIASLAAGCGAPAAAPTAAVMAEAPSAAPIPTAVLPSPTPTPPAAATPDACAGATSGGARQKFTFEQIAPCLDKPESLVAFMRNNLAWDGGWDNKTYGDNAYSPAWEVYENGIDDCDGLAEFAACVLSRNGYEAYNVGISILGPAGHNVAGYVGKDGLKYAINNGQDIEGPFDSWEALAQSYIDRKIAAPPEGVLWLFSPCIESRAVGNDMLSLTHTVLR